MTPEQSTEELSDFELTQRLRAARGQEPLPDPDGLEAKLRAGAKAMLEDHRMRGLDYSRIAIDDPIPMPVPAPFDVPATDTYKWKMKLDYLHTVKPISYMMNTSDNAIALAGGTITGRLTGWTGKE
jgi:hypothetical protein